MSSTATTETINETCGSCNADIGPSATYPWHNEDEDCRAVRQPITDSALPTRVATIAPKFDGAEVKTDELAEYLYDHYGWNIHEARQWATRAATTDALVAEVGRLRDVLQLTLTAMRGARDNWSGYEPDVQWLTAWDAARAALRGV